MIRWLLSLFAWREVHDSGLWHGVWSYQENRITGARRAVRVGGGYNPLNRDWLERRAPADLPLPPPPSRK